MSKRRPAPTCTSKIRHETKARALDASMARRRGGAHLRAVNVYRCPYCRGWHIGHQPGSGRKGRARW